jgi:hypothetical protein
MARMVYCALPMLLVLIPAGCAKTRSALRAPQCASDPAALPAGMEAPEIAGEDMEGVPFKLSDYRGKVVLLDFWGHW